MDMRKIIQKKIDQVDIAIKGVKSNTWLDWNLDVLIYTKKQLELWLANYNLYQRRKKNADI
jgi:hypothetical protein